MSAPAHPPFSPARPAQFGIKGLIIKPAAEGLQEGTGHHHLLVDLKSAKAGTELPFDEQHLHYGKARRP